MKRKPQCVGGGGGGVHGLHGGGDLNGGDARPGGDPRNAIIFNDKADMILVVPAMIGCNDD